MMTIRCGVLALAAAAGAASAQISQVNYFLLSGTGSESFEGFAGGGAPGTNYDGVVSNANVSFGERLAGQTLGFVGQNDQLGGSPTGPLSVAVGAAGQNLNIFVNNDSNVITGLGRTGYPNFDSIGEGALAFVFNVDQGEFGFQLVGGDGGSAFLDFFARDGSLIQSITVNGLSNSFYGFRRDGGLEDIAGVSIWNEDGGGIGLDNLRFTIPAPSAAGLLGLAALTAGRRRR